MIVACEMKSSETVTVSLLFCARRLAAGEKNPSKNFRGQLVEKGRQLAAFFSSYHPTCSKMYVG